MTHHYTFIKRLKKLVKHMLQVVGYDYERIRLKKRYQAILAYRFRTILDIGANVGQFSKEMLSLFPDAHVYAFEPVASCYEKLKGISNATEFHPFPYALGNKNGEMEIHVSSYDPSSSLLKMSDLHKRIFPHTAGEHNERIQIRRLNDTASELELQTPLLIKMDVQGYEKEVILGGEKVFAQASVIITEISFVSLYEDQPLADEIKTLLGSMGFTYHGFLSQKKNPQTGQILFEDALFLREPVEHA